VWAWWGDGPARLTAATVVSATGALLLLAAAATFLAVSWDTLGLTARVAAVGAGTAGAIIGGARLRRTLPAVGTVVFHLGALLLPVDALGLALHLEAGRAATWIAVGATSVVALPVAAHLGRSRVLAAAAVAGVPVLTTGLGLAGVAPAPLLTAGGALLALAVVRADRRAPAGGAEEDDEAVGPRRVLGLTAPALAITAVAGPLLVAVGSGLAVAGGGRALQATASAGWVPATWVHAAIAGGAAVLALGATAALRRSVRWAGAVPVLVVLAAVTLLLPGDAPRLARLLPLPLLLLAVESIAIAVRRDRVLAGLATRAALVAEVFALLAVPGALVTAAVPFGADPVMGATALVVALGWVLATWRWSTLRPTPTDEPPPPAAGLTTTTGAFRVRSTSGALSLATVLASGAATVTAAAALNLFAPSAGLGVLLLLLGTLATAAVHGGGLLGVTTSLGAALLGVSVLIGSWEVTAASGPATAVDVSLVVVAASIVAAVLTLRIRRHAEAGEGRPATILLLPGVLVAVIVAGSVAELAVGFGPSIAVAAALLLVCGASLTAVPVGADVLRGLAVAGVLLAEPAEAAGLEAAVVVLPATVLVAAGLVTEAVRCRRSWLLIAAGGVLVRAVAGGAYAISGSRVATGVVLFVLAVVAAAAALARRELRAAGAVTAVAAGISAIVLLSLSPVALAWGTIGVGLLVVAIGLVVREAPIAHVGGILATFGVWQLLDLAGVTAVDVWLLAPALQLWLGRVPARRAGRVSSWVADVPPLALVVVTALLERLAGGGGWHAVLAGGVAVLAVVGGGIGRHGGPLVVGVVAVVGVVLVETLAVVADVPTWFWLTAGGVVLLGTGALIERSGGSPVASVRRLADVIAERFD
jgi:hypothetical protein